MQQQCWIHPEYTLKKSGLPEAKQCGRKQISAPGLQALFIATGYLSIALTILIVCLNAQHSLVTEYFESNDHSVDALMQKHNLVNSKSAFLNKIGAPDRQYVASQVQYIADLIRRTSNKISDSERRLAKAIVTESLKANYDPLFVAAVIKSESTFNRHAVSNQGAQGLMQLLPETGQYISRRARLDWQGAWQLKDPEYNIRLGIAYLKYLEEKFDGNREQVLIAYNWGPGNLGLALRNQKTVPSSPLRYARKIIQNHETFRRELESRFAMNGIKAPTSLIS